MAVCHNEDPPQRFWLRGGAKLELWLHGKAWGFDGVPASAIIGHFRLSNPDFSAMSMGSNNEI